MVAILADETLPDLKVTLVEGDRRKAAFLSEAIRQLKLRAEVFSGRVESLTETRADVVSARAFAPLHKLLAEASRHLSDDGVGLFMKGQSYQAEIAEAGDRWAYDCDVVPSKTDANSVVLRVRRVRHVEPYPNQPDAHHCDCEPEGRCWQDHDGGQCRGLSGAGREAHPVD